MTRDEIFRVENIKEDFVFNDQVAEVFDDMLDRSIPCYRQVIEMIARLLEKRLKQGDMVYDLGCSTGTTLLELARRLESLKLKFMGVDNSAAMIRKAVLKAEMYSRKEAISFQERDIMELEIEGAGAVILNYTLQFIRPLMREEFLRKISFFLRPGGILLVSEKIICRDPQLNRDYIDFYHQYKRSRGYSELEIAKKREALENVLIPFTIRENRELLRSAGFSTVETFFQWFNYASFVAIKK